MFKFFKKNKNSNKEKKIRKRMSKEKFSKCLKYTLLSYFVFSLLSAFFANMFLFIGCVVSLALLALVLYRSPLPEKNVYLYHSKNPENLDISFFPKEYKAQIIKTYGFFIEYFKNNNIPIPNSDSHEFEFELIEGGATNEEENT